MWPLEVIKKINASVENEFPIDQIRKELIDFDTSNYSFKKMQHPVVHNKRCYYYILYKNEIGKKILDNMIYDPNMLLHIEELNLYLL